MIAPSSRARSLGRLEDRLAHDAHERHRRAAGHGRSRHGRPPRRLHRRTPRSASPGRSFIIVIIFISLALHRHERPRRALRRRGRGRQGRPHRLSGVPDRDRDLAAASWRRSGTSLSPSLLDLVNAAPAVKAEALPFLRIMFLLQQRHARLLHARRRAALGRRCANADGPRHRDDGAEPRAQRHPHSRAGSDSGVRHRRRGDGNGDRLGAGGDVRALEALERRLGRLLPARRQASGPTGRSSGRCSGSACRPAFRASR